jgi:hypothetical protein
LTTVESAFRIDLDALMRRGFIRLGGRSGCAMQFSGYHHDLDVDCEARVGDPSNSFIRLQYAMDDYWTGEEPTHDGLGADIAAATRPVVDNKLLAEPLRQPLSHQAREDVGRAARRERHDDAHRPRRIGLRKSEARDGRERGGTRGQVQKISAAE